jgi:transcription termination factor Rho
LAERRIFPAIDIPRSGTRREELLLDEQTIKQVWLLRRMVSMIASDSSSNSHDGTQLVLDRLHKTKTNVEFLATLSKGTLD